MAGCGISTDPATNGCEDLSVYKDAVLRALPDLADAPFRLRGKGWHSLAIEAGGLIFKFPQNTVARAALEREAALLAIVRPRLTLAVPDMRVITDPLFFSCHTELPGDHLLNASYMTLPEVARVTLGTTLGRFHAELHRMDMTRMQAAGAIPVQRWQSPQAVRHHALPHLPDNLRAAAEHIVAAYAILPPDPLGHTYSHFDAHGWNMAFDRPRRRLNGIYDFADSGIGPVHQDFVAASFISPDLTRRIIAAYEDLTERRLDRARIATLTGYHRLSELAELADDPAHVPEMVDHVAGWLKAAGAA